jgi:hypothetical protein
MESRTRPTTQHSTTTLAELGLNQSARAQKFAMIPENIFRETIAETISKVRIVSPPFSSARRLQTGDQFFRPLFPRRGNNAARNPDNRVALFFFLRAGAALRVALAEAFYRQFFPATLAGAMEVGLT